MKKQTKRSQMAKLTRQNILKCAKILFDQEDFKNVSIAELAEASQTSIGCIYGHFKSKEEIYLQIMVNKANDDNDKYYQNLLTNKELDSFSRFTEFFIFQQKYFALPEIIKISYIQALKHPEDGYGKNFYSNNLYTTWQDIIANCKKDGFINESWGNETVYFQMMLLSRGIAFSWVAAGCTFDIVESSKNAISIFLNGLKSERIE